MSHRSLAELEEAQDRERHAARRAVEEAEQRLEHYRSQMNAMFESSYRFAESLGVAEQSGFRQALQRLVDHTDEQVREGSRTILDLDDDLGRLTAQHDRQREDFIQAQRR
jgi:type II secretory pathway component PulF